VSLGQDNAYKQLLISDYDRLAGHSCAIAKVEGLPVNLREDVVRVRRKGVGVGHVGVGRIVGRIIDGWSPFNKRAFLPSLSGPYG